MPEQLQFCTAVGVDVLDVNGVPVPCEELDRFTYIPFAEARRVDKVAIDPDGDLFTGPKQRPKLVTIRGRRKDLSRPNDFVMGRHFARVGLRTEPLVVRRWFHGFHHQFRALIIPRGKPSSLNFIWI